MSPGSFVELVRDIEDEIDNSLALTVNRSIDHSSFSSNMHDIYHDLDQMRKKELRIPVQMFADMLAENLLKLSPKNVNRVPLFDSRRGFQAWITKLVTIFSVQEVFHAAMRIKHEHEKTTKSDWRLR
ncbi:hypothetical protein AA18895_0893 [Acetobacter ghanensis DSM 18895]|nr:hypothetical protein AA18895_0893 [Acetobacter ghanensis DSM 18895]